MNLERLFFSNAYLQDLSLSTPAITSKPSSFKPCDSPPIPQNRSTTLILGFVCRFLRPDNLVDMITHSPRLNMNSVGYELGMTSIGYMNLSPTPSALPSRVTAAMIH